MKTNNINANVKVSKIEFNDGKKLILMKMI
mgnify:CR=1 FL=1